MVQLLHCQLDESKPATSEDSRVMTCRFDKHAERHACDVTTACDMTNGQHCTSVLSSMHETSLCLLYDTNLNCL